ncbi:AlpA family phage regulatory protein [Mesorhizobium sp. B2-7-1]|uniref:helix-turn-helix transcriptional regulator n=1 Tax=Mesorhizobium sp. B2-7-1 TaxID=2589909 RepID=UPI0011286132|nr:AlpA family phage regulatory protein [Mesorhizobium sp. B2-7-1]TPJ46837.1 AlpA family phage regulatory protein [Mesorhizobium sp. B2-7-1]
MTLIPLDKLPSKGINYSRNYIDKLIKDDRFPKPVFLSPRRRAFIEADIDAWVQARVDQPDLHRPPPQEPKEPKRVDHDEVAA